MKFDLFSDLHCDIGDVFDGDKFENELVAAGMPGATIAVVAGDTANSVVMAKRALRIVADHYDRVLFVDGNHEFYDRRPFTDVEWDLAKIADEIPNMTYLSCDSASIDDVGFVGTNGWYDFKVFGLDRDVALLNWRRMMNDCYIKFGSLDPDEIAYGETMSLQDKVEKYDENPGINKIVVVTHTAPLGRLVRKPPFEDSVTGDFFANVSMGEAIIGFSDKVKVWCYGHSHVHHDEEMFGIRFVNNAHGYPGEVLNWRVKTLEV